MKALGISDQEWMQYSKVSDRKKSVSLYELSRNREIIEVRHNEVNPTHIFEDDSSSSYTSNHQLSNQTFNLRAPQISFPKADLENRILYEDIVLDIESKSTHSDSHPSCKAKTKKAHRAFTRSFRKRNAAKKPPMKYTRNLLKRSISSKNIRYSNLDQKIFDHKCIERKECATFHVEQEDKVKDNILQKHSKFLAFFERSSYRGKKEYVQKWVYLKICDDVPILRMGEMRSDF